MSREQSLDEIALFNGIVTPVGGGQQKVSFTGTSAQSPLTFITDMVQIYVTQDCWLRFGASPVAVADDNDSNFHPGGFIKAYRVKIGDKLAVVRDTTSGDLHIQGGA